MCRSLNNSIKAYAAFLHRCKGFTDDGYNLIFSHQDEMLWFNKYRHQNGNVVEVKLYPKTLTIEQLSNGKLCYSCKMYQP